MFDFANVLTTDRKPQHKATAVFATGPIMLAIFGILILAQLMFAILDPATLAAAVRQGPLGVVAP
jgi:hypothetical protein